MALGRLPDAPVQAGPVFSVTVQLLFTPIADWHAGTGTEEAHPAQGRAGGSRDRTEPISPGCSRSALEPPPVLQVR